MKNLTFLILLLPILLSAQDYLVTFSGSGESSTVSAVMVENLTQNKSLTLNGTDVLHLKNTVTAISDLEYNQSDGIQFYPNPMKEFSIMEFAMAKEGVAKVELFDISGRKLTQTENYLNLGKHSYRITGVGNGIYVLKVTAGSYLYTGKLISDKKASELVNITYQNTIPFNDNPVITKSAKSEILMQYNTGDVLKFTGTSVEKKAVVVEVISQSKNIDFSFYNCVDADKNNYATVKIGTQVWMAENLKTTKYNDGTNIPNVTDNRAWDNLTTPGYCWYYNDAANFKNTYGALYNWYTVNTGKLCPTGWHVPSDTEWTTLTTYLGGESVAGQTMKSTNGWRYNSEFGTNKGTNTSGFSALPGGYRDYRGAFSNANLHGYWWSSKESNAAVSWYRSLSYDVNYVIRNYFDKEVGFSVRCVSD